MALTILTPHLQDYQNQTFPQLSTQSQYALPWSLGRNFSAPFTGPVSYGVNTTGVKAVTLVPGVEDVTAAMYSPVGPADIYGTPLINGVYTQVTFTPSGSIQGSPVTLVEAVGAFAYYGTELTAYNALTNYFLQNDYPRGVNIAAFTSITNAIDQQLTGAHAATVAQELSSAAQSSLASGDVQFYDLAQALIPIAENWDTPEYFLDTGSGLKSASLLDFNFGVNLLSVNGAEATWKVNGSSGGITVTGFTADGYAVPNNNGGVTPYYATVSVIENGQLEPAATGTVFTPQSFTGGTSDLLFQNTDGTPAIWLMNGLNLQSGALLANPGSSWQAAATGDFDRSGNADILWQNTDGLPAIWEMNGTSVVGSEVLPNPGQSWHIVAAADFNGDGSPDILWQNTDGTPAIWSMNGLSIAGAGVLPNPGSGWRAIGAGDFNGDGNADILWQNTDGAAAIWEMNGASIVAAGMLPDPGSSWHAIGTGDFNGDGNADILWQNTDGTPAIWEMNGTSIVAAAVLPNPGSSWHAIGTSDFNGDGKADIVWQNTDGTPAIWEMNGTSIVAAAVLPNPGSSWHVQDNGPNPPIR